MSNDTIIHSNTLLPFLFLPAIDIFLFFEEVNNFPSVLPFILHVAFFTLHLSPLPSTPLKVKVKVTQSCPTLCNPMDYTVHGILQARILKWIAILFSKKSSQPRDQTQVSHIAGGFFTN
ncbi:unnamed protein product [Rangifer tarandus platyrhynchus]|uniref:Uncharacterized protein n=2 Tax=Rangifer tarandus platyrhynchus TaxID=3082113 RepID=A0ABN9A151_RANTA|nr:unnamed protein product [Rangifer tarandus platyrhynchus]